MPLFCGYRCLCTAAIGLLHNDPVVSLHLHPPCTCLSFSFAFSPSLLCRLKHFFFLRAPVRSTAHNCFFFVSFFAHTLCKWVFMATGITISIHQQYFSRLIAKFLNCTSELLIRHDRGGEIVIFRRWQPAEAAWDAKGKDWLKWVYSAWLLQIFLPCTLFPQVKNVNMK